MKIFDSIKQNMKQKQDNKIMEEIKNSNNPKEMYELIRKLQLDDSRMQIFNLFDDNHVYDSFKAKKYDEIENVIENPYEIFIQLENDKDRFTIIQYLYEYGIDNIGLCTCMGETSCGCKEILLRAMKTQEYKEKVLDIMYSTIDFNYESIGKIVLDIIDNMEIEKRENFLKNHNFSDKIAMELYYRYKDESIIQNLGISMEENLSKQDNYFRINKVDKQEKVKLLELYGNTMSLANLKECVCAISGNTEDLKNTLNKYYTKLKDEISNMFISTTLWSYNYKNIEMFIENFSKDIDEKDLNEILENYKESLIDAEYQIKRDKRNEDKIKEFVDHDKEDSQFLYNMVCEYYDTKIEDKEFEPTLINKVISNLPAINRLEFVSKYKDSISILI